MIGIVLAAGKGSRLSNQDIDHKCLIKIGHDRVIDYNLKMLVNQNVSKIIVVVNFNAEKIISYIGDSYLGVPIKYVYQRELKGVAHAILCAKDLIDDDFIMCLADEILINEHISDMIKYFYQENLFCLCGTYVNDNDYSGKPLAYDLNAEGYITDVREKSNIFTNKYRGIGECVFKKETIYLLDNLQQNSIRKELEMGDWIQLIANKYKMVKLFEIADNCININFNEDIEHAKKLIEKNSTSKYNDLVYIILNHNKYQLTINAVENILTIDAYANIIIVDNASTNNSWEILNNQFNNNNNIRLIQNTTNGGYAQGNNYALNRVKIFFPYANYVAIMNPDVEIPTSDTISILYEDIKSNPEIALITAITKYNGKIEFPNECAWEYPSKLHLLLKGTLLGKLFKFKNTDFIIVEPRKKIQYVDVVQGCFFIANYDNLYDVNFFDDRIFIYYDEHILAKKIDKLGKKKAVATNAVINHNHLEKLKELQNNKSKMFYSDCYHDSRKIYVNNYSGYSKLFCFLSSIIIVLDKYLKRFVYTMLSNFKKLTNIKDILINYYPIIFVCLFLFIDTFGFNPKLFNDSFAYPTMVAPYIPMNITIACFVISLFGIALAILAKQIKFDLISLLLMIRIILYFIATIIVKETNYKIGDFYAIVQCLLVYLICKNYKKDMKYLYLVLLIFTIFISLEIYYIPIKNNVNFLPTIDAKSKLFMVLPMGKHNYITCILIPLYLLISNAYLKNSVQRFLYSIMIGLAVIVTYSRWGLIVFIIFALINAISNFKQMIAHAHIYRYIIIFISFVVVCIIFWPYILPALTNIVSRFSSAIFTSRLQVFKESLEVFLKHPWLGRAAYSYSVYDANSAHNFILESLVQTGIIGTLIYFTSLFIAIKKIINISDSKVRKGFILAICVILFQGLAEPNMFGLRSDFMFWIILTFGISQSSKNPLNE